MNNFDSVRKNIAGQFTSPNWIDKSGLDEAALKEGYEQLMLSLSDAPRTIIKARTFEYLTCNGRIAVDKDDIFQDKLEHFDILNKQRSRWFNEVVAEFFTAEKALMKKASLHSCGAYSGGEDFGHTSPNTRLMVKIGFTGILKRVKDAASREGLTDKQKEFYDACIITWEAVLAFCVRLAKAVEPYNKENADALYAIASRAPENSYEAMQLVIVYFFLHEYVAGTRVRTLGRVDLMLYPFYKNDIESGKYTKSEIKEMLKYFFHKFWAAKVPFDLPFAIGGIDRDGSETTNELSYLIVETYNELDIHSPKIHVRISDKTPADFVKLVLGCIRAGNSSFVFVNDTVTVKALMSVGIEEADARDYTPIGCYEPAVWGVEIGCTGTGGGNLAKAVEFVITNGRDLHSGELLGVETGATETYEEFIDAIKKQIAHIVECPLSFIRKIEKKYSLINPDLLLSAQYDRCVELGVDAYEGGAKYNNSSYNMSSIASLVDSVAAVKRLVFDLKRVPLHELFEILKNDWQGHEKLRLEARKLPEKYGNGDPLADSLAREFSDFYADLVNNKPNGRGGVFKAGLFGIDHYVLYGKNTMATPDGRKAGEPLSKNLCPMSAMDKNGVTALIKSVTAMDHSKFPNGSVLDIILHPSAVQGDDGLDAFYGILMTYMKKGGFAMHGNVFNSDDLRAAQKDPAKYKNLQVRVCGWNAYFVNLTKAEQDEFIKQAENAC